VRGRRNERIIIVIIVIASEGRRNGKIIIVIVVIASEGE